MIYFGQLVIGPAGSGKSTYCKTIQEMGQLMKRNIWVINLDPAAEIFTYKCDFDIRELISVDDVCEELKLGPNGALVFCIEYLLQNFDFLEEFLRSLAPDDYVLFDCPGQIELYVHLDFMSQLVQRLQSIGFSICSIYLVDVLLLSDERKFQAGMLMAMSAMMNIQLPHLTVLTKCDLIQDKKLLKKYIQMAEEGEDEFLGLDDFPTNHKINILGMEMPSEKSDEQQLQNTQNDQIETPLTQKYQNLQKEINKLINEYSMIDLLRLDLNDNNTIKKIIYQADMLIQYGEGLEPNEKTYQEAENILGL